MTLSKKSAQKRGLSALVAVLMAFTGLAAIAAPAYATPSGGGNANKATICHRTNSATNPYEQITVDLSAVDGNGSSDHLSHTGRVPTSLADAATMKANNEKWGDIIPLLDAAHPGQNWTKEGQAIHDNGCNFPTSTPPTDVCSNIAGVQTTVPAGLVLEGTKCVTPPTDVCSNIAGVQTTVPDNYALVNGQCEPDICDNLAGVQATVPDGYAVEYGLCTTINAIYVVAADPTYTPGTCSKVGTIVTQNTAQYTWEASGTSAATIETATPVGDVVLDGDLVYGRAVFGPYDLTKLTGDGCLTTPKNASASVAVGTAQTCSDSSVETFTVTNATLSKVDGKTATVLDKTVGDHVAVFTANTNHQFADGTTSLTLNYTVTAHTASQSTDSSKICYVKPITPTCSVTAPSPLTASWVNQYVDVVWTANTGHFTAALKAGVHLCGSVTILVSGYAVPATWDGKGFNSTAVPQQLVGTTKRIVLTNDVRTGEATADLPNCGNAQADGYTPPEIVVVTSDGHGSQFIAGGLWHIADCVHVTAVKPTNTPGTCSKVGAIVAPNTAQYTWKASGTEAATFETATAVGNVVLDGKTVFGPYDLSKLSGVGCSSTITPTPTPTPTTATTPPTTGIPGGGTDGGDIVGTHVSSSVTGGFNPFELLFAIMAGLAVGLIVWFKTWKHLPFMRKRDVSAGA